MWAQCGVQQPRLQPRLALWPQLLNSVTRLGRDRKPVQRHRHPSNPGRRAHSPSTARISLPSQHLPAGHVGRAVNITAEACELCVTDKQVRRVIQQTNDGLQRQNRAPDVAATHGSQKASAPKTQNSSPAAASHWGHGAAAVVRRPDISSALRPHTAAVLKGASARPGGQQGTSPAEQGQTGSNPQQPRSAAAAQQRHLVHCTQHVRSAGIEKQQQPVTTHQQASLGTHTLQARSVASPQRQRPVAATPHCPPVKHTQPVRSVAAAQRQHSAATAQQPRSHPTSAPPAPVAAAPGNIKSSLTRQAQPVSSSGKPQGDAKSVRRPAGTPSSPRSPPLSPCRNVAPSAVARKVAPAASVAAHARPEKHAPASQHSKGKDHASASARMVGSHVLVWPTGENRVPTGRSCSATCGTPTHVTAPIHVRADSERVKEAATGRAQVSDIPDELRSRRQVCLCIVLI